MSMTHELDMQERLAVLEAAVASIQATLGSQSPSPQRNAAAGSRNESASRASDFTRLAAQAGPGPSEPRKRARTAVPSAGFARGVWYDERTAEWWLGGLGIVFLLISLFLLYRYAVDHNWITPLVRVSIGVIIGAGLIAAGFRLTPRKTAESDDAVGLREILLGGGVAALYIASYAAAVSYALISIQSARICFAGLSVFAGWLALEERRLAFALIAVGVGFAAPSLLLSPVHSLSGISLYLGTLGALGLVLYLMRGWQSVIWITFIGFWISPSIGFAQGASTMSRVVATVVVVALGAAFTRVPVLRRRLLALGSDLYAPSTTPDVNAVWFMTLAAPLFMLSRLAWLWPDVPRELWGIAAVALGTLAFLMSKAKDSDAEVTHLELTGTVLWTLVGSLLIASGLAPRVGLAAGPVSLAVAALHAIAAIHLIMYRELRAARGVAKVTALIALMAVVGYELAHSSVRAIEWDWTLAEAIVLGAAAFAWRELSREPSEELQGIVFGVTGYATLLLVLSRVLGSIWPPLVTVSFAIAGAMLLMLARREDRRGLLLKLGALTMLLVVGRLLIVDLSSFETIWRVLLFLACGLAFTYISYRMQPARKSVKAGTERAEGAN